MEEEHKIDLGGNFGEEKFGLLDNFQLKGEESIIESTFFVQEEREIEVKMIISDDEDESDYESDEDEIEEGTRDYIEEYETKRPMIEQLRHQAGGEVWAILEVYLGLEQMAIERLVLIARQLELNDDLFADILTANFNISEDKNRRVRRITQNPRPRQSNSLLAENLKLSGLI